MISKRGLIVAGALGTGSVLFAAGSALACNINDFNVGATASCDITSGSPMAQISITDTDSSGTTSDVSIFTRNADGSNGTQVGTLTFSNNHGTTTQQATVPWVANGVWNVVVNANRYMQTTTASVHPGTGNATCAVQKPSPSTSATPTQPAPASSAPATVAPAPSQSSAGSVLAETGGGSDSGMIAGFAAALVVAGGGVLYTVRRRGAAARHN